ncbi:MAG: DMT family transporter [Thermoplasmatales archaeon]|nr:DMT family transporter [Thermoplasmatales archaeon]
MKDLEKSNVTMTKRWSIAKLAETYGALVTLSLIWGLAFVAIKIMEPMVTPINLTLLRWFIAGGAFLVLLPIFGKPRVPIERRDIPRLLLVSFANVVAYHLTINYSEGVVGAGLETLLVALGPIFMVILSAIFLRERHGRTIYLAILLAFAGSLILFFGTVQATGPSTIPGILEGVGTALSYATFAVFAKPLLQKFGARAVTIWVGLIGTAMLLPLLSGSFISQVIQLPISGWVAILYLSLLSTVFGYILFYTMIERGGVAKISIQLYLVPVFGIVGGVLILGESVTDFTLIGGATMLIAVGLTTVKTKPPHSGKTDSR